MSDIEEILNQNSPVLPDYCQLGGRVFITDGNRVNRVVFNSLGDWRPMGAKEQVAALDVTVASESGGPLHYGDRVTYALRRVVTANGVVIEGGLSVEYTQIEAGNSETELAATVTIMPYEYDLPDGASVSYELYRSMGTNTELLYQCAVLDSTAVSALTQHQYTDMALATTIEIAKTIDLASDGWDMTIPAVRYIRAWKGALVCGGSCKMSITVNGTEGVASLSAEPAFTVDDVGSFVSIPGEPYTYQILDVASGVASLDAALANDLEDVAAVRYRDDDVIYISRPLPENIEVYSAESGRLLSNQGSDNAITGIAVNGSYCFIFRRNNVEILTGSPASPQLEPHPASPPGCRSHATIADTMTPMVIYYAGQNGVWTIENGKAERVSMMVDPLLIDEVDHSQDEFCHAVYDPSVMLYYLFVFGKGWEEKGIRMPDKLFIWDVATRQWTTGELSASRSGLFRDAAGEMRAVIGTPGGVALLGVGDTDGDYSVVGTLVSHTSNELTLDVDCEEHFILPGQPVHLMARLDSPAMSAVRRIVKGVDGEVVTIYGELPEGDFTGWRVMIGAIRWEFRTPEIGLGGDFDRQLRLDTLAIAHRKEDDELPVVVTARTIGEMSDRDEDWQHWRGVFDFSTRSVSRIDGKTTGLRGASLDVEAEGPRAPALIKGIRVETSRVAR